MKRATNQELVEIQIGLRDMEGGLTEFILVEIALQLDEINRLLRIIAEVD